MLSQVETRLWTRKEYHCLAEWGLFGPDEHLELLEGRVMVMPPQKSTHAWSVARTAEVLRAQLGSGFHVREEKPIVLSDVSEPEPDIVVVRGTLQATPEHPTPANTMLVVEVSDSTLAFDQAEKAAAYARAGIAEYWIVNLRNRRLEILRDPGSIGESVGVGEYGYRSIRFVLPGQAVRPVEIPQVVIEVGGLLPVLAKE